ncbi:MAG: DUF3048 domain-containing protein [Lachnospiraceae bacterium]|nr:DUF3048 domain-containing protein [Lachnospiraceae bacterium]
MKEKIATFFGKVKDFYTSEDTKKKAFIITGCSLAAVILIIVLIAVFSGGKSDDPGTQVATNPTGEVTVTPEPTEEPSSTPVPTEEPTPTEPEVTPDLPSPTPDLLEIHLANGEKQSYINGQWVKEEIANQRPYCMMFNNIAIANPQSGIGCADILYEILVEGNITRCMGVFENLTEESSCKDRMGSVRSARHYYASIASEYDAIFIHYGETTYATKKIAALKLDHLEGTYGEGNIIFYRDKNIKAPHNAFATLEGIHKAIEQKKFRTDHKEDFVPQHFDFAYPEIGVNSIDKIEYAKLLLDEIEQRKQLFGSPMENNDENVTENVTEESVDEEAIKKEIQEISTAALVKLPFSSYAQPYLTYDEETKLYTRYQYGGVHIDYNTNEPLTFNNIIIQIVQESNRDKNGYQDIEGYGDRDGHHDPVEGKGYYICEGKCIEITWAKNEAAYTMNYYTLDGEKLKLRPGKTFIALFPHYRADKIEIE